MIAAGRFHSRGKAQCQRAPRDLQAGGYGEGALQPDLPREQHTSDGNPDGCSKKIRAVKKAAMV